VVRTKEEVAMSPSIREHTDDRNIELGSGVSWSAILAASGLGLAVLIVVLVVSLLPRPAAAPREEPTVASWTPRPSWADTLRVPARPEPRIQPQKSQPEPTPAVVATAKPAVPETPKPQPKPEPAEAAPTSPPVAVAAAPAPAEPPRIVPEPHSPAFKRRHAYNEEALRAQLAELARNLDMETEKGTTAKLLSEPSKFGASKSPAEKKSTEKEAPRTPAEMHPALELIARRADLKGLPVRDVADCQAPAKEAKSIETLSREVRRGMRNIRPPSSDVSYHGVLQRGNTLVRYIESLSSKEWGAEVGVRMLVQMFQNDVFPVRQKIVRVLALNKGKSASAILARWAVFDLHSEIREAAVEALKGRPREEYRSVLLDALRYPWAPVADHAAEALVALCDREAAGELARLLDQPDPLAPVQNKEKKWVVPELVRVNHFGNCALCHAPSLAREDPVRGLVPDRSQPIPEVYYESKSGIFVRADVTYLKQDFSLMERVEEPKEWPRMQRFDYLVRQRELSEDEVSRLPAKDPAAGRTTYPQRDAVRWALCRLTGEDLGSRSEDWIPYLRKEKLIRDP
jgi:hypothetical protein